MGRFGGCSFYGDENSVLNRTACLAGASGFMKMPL